MTETQRREQLRFLALIALPLPFAGTIADAERALWKAGLLLPRPPRRPLPPRRTAWR